jgi:hypothetical protein
VQPIELTGVYRVNIGKWRHDVYVKGQKLLLNPTASLILRSGICCRVINHAASDIARSSIFGHPTEMHFRIVGFCT